MDNEIVLTYKTETLNMDNLTERERAIYDAGVGNGYASAEVSKFYSMFLGIALFIFIVVYSLVSFIR